MKRLNDDQINVVVELLKEGKPLPEEYRWLLFEGRQETELMYIGKAREVDVLAETMSVPLQKVKVFGDAKDDQWHNMLIFGDNLQILKTLLRMKDEGKLKNPDGTRGVKLIYIDPPFGTGDVYGNGDVAAYSARLMGAKYLEWLRQRIILLKELLSDDGSLHMRTDYHFGHYMKCLLDEIFGRENFRNEITVSRGRNIAGAREKMEVDNDLILWYSKSSNFVFREVKVRRPVSEIKWTSFLMAGDRFPRERVFLGKTLSPPPGQHFALIQPTVDRLLKEYYIRLKCRSCATRFYYGKSSSDLYRRMKQKEHRFKFYDVTAETNVYGVESLENCPECRNGNFVVEYLGASERKISNIWLDIESYSRSTGFPTENSEELLARIIELSSDNVSEGDVVLDAFAGSGATGSVAEKLGRRWIMIDSSKFALYTMTKRMLNLKEKISNKGRPLKARPFVIYNAGLYDMRMLKELPFKEYREFALQLFQCKDERHKLAGVELDGYLGQDHVLVFKWKRNSGKKDEFVMDRGFIDDLHSILGNRISNRFFIIAPAASVLFLEDYIERDHIRYYVLRIPYSVIDELHKKNFKLLEQPLSADIAAVNKVMEQVGFDFIYPPDVECDYYIDKQKGKLFEEVVIKIERFRSNIISKRPISEEELGLKALSMVMIDYDYNGEYFEMDDRWFASELASNGYEVRFTPDKVGEKMMIIYMDIYGNERKEVKSLKAFRHKG